MFYDSTPLETRGIWLLQNWLLIWTNPMARPKEEDLFQGFWPWFPHFQKP
jgi:hypothetical protein